MAVKLAAASWSRCSSSGLIFRQTTHFVQRYKSTTSDESCYNQTLEKAIVWPKVMVLFGDSLTEYSFSFEGAWGAVLAERLQRKCDVVARGFRGYNTTMCRTLLPAVFPSFGSPIAALTIFLGANDANWKKKNPLQHVPLEEYMDNLKWMVHYLESQGLPRDKVILIFPPAFNAERWSAYRKLKEPSKDNVTTKLYSTACVDVAKSLGCDYVDVFHLMETKYDEVWDDLLRDGLHFSREGSFALIDSLWPLIEKRTAQLPLLFPLKDEMDVKDPAASIKRWIASYRYPSC